MSCSNVAYIVVPITILFILLLLLGLVLQLTYSTKFVRVSPPSRPYAALVPTNMCRIRFANMQVLPIPYVISTRKKAKKAAALGILENVDVIFMQEMFSRIIVDKTDVLLRLMDVNPALQAASTEVSLPKGYFTDSGLAAAAMDPWCVKFVAFHGFKTRKFPCSMAYKGVTVFEVNSTPPFRIANTHLQAESRKDDIQKEQFEEAVQFALSHGALLIGGDMNVTNEEMLGTMSAIVFRLTNGKGTYVQHDGKSTCCKSMRGVYLSEERLDHVWLLNSDAISCSSVITRDDLTDGLSDHACMELTVSVK